MKSPRGVFRFTHLNKPDTKFDADGVYTVKVAFDKDDPRVQKFIEKIDELHAEAGEEMQKAWDEMKPAAKKKLATKKITEPTLMPCYEDELDDDGDPTGKVLMNFKTKAQFISKKTGKTIQKVIPFFDAKGQMIPDKKRPLVYGGTVGQVDFNTRSAFIPAQGEGYLSFYLNNVRILQLVTNGGGDWDEDEDYGFDGNSLQDRPDAGGNSGGDSEDDGDGYDDDLGDGDTGGSGDDYDDEIPF